MKSQPVIGEILDWVTHDGTGRNSLETLFWIQATEKLVPASSKYMHMSIDNFRNSNWKYTELLCLSCTLISSFSYSKLAGNTHYSLLLIQYGHNSARSPILQADCFHLSQHGSPRILEWVAYPFSRGSFRPRNWTGVSSIAGKFFTSWATKGALYLYRT